MTFTLHLQCNKIRLYERSHMQLQLIQTNKLLWWWTHQGPFVFARDVAGVGAIRVLRAVMRWEGGVFAVLDSPGLVTAPVRMRRGQGLVRVHVPM